MRHLYFYRRATLGLLVAFVPGCFLVSTTPAESRSERAQRVANEHHHGGSASSSRDADASGERHKTEAPPLPPLGDCPTDMTLSPGGRQIDARRAPEAKVTSFAKGHSLPPPDNFVLSKDKSVELVVALEKKNPGVVPSGFRDLAKAAPKDSTLRLRMARCELEHDETRRRASYDAAMSILLAGKTDAAMAILLESTQNQLRGDNLSSSCRASNDCGKGSTCDPVRKSCVSPTEQATSHISASELEIEDALSRAIFKLGMSFDEYKEYDYFWWFAKRLHRCDASNLPCEMSGYASRVVSWDLRDGGGSYSPPANVQQWYRDHCVTGSTDTCDQKKPNWVP